MAIIAYSQKNEFDLVESGKNCMGWTVVDQAGNDVGTVSEMLLDTDEMLVDSILVNDKVRIPAEDINLHEGKVVVRGILHKEQYAETQRAAQTADYKPLPRNQKAANVAGVTREAGEDEIILPVIEENLIVGKRTVEKAGVNVKTTIAEQPIAESVNLRQENVTVARNKVDLPIDETDAFKEGTFEIRTQAEVPVISKEARIVEEVVIGKEVTERTETVRDTIKRTEVEVVELDADETAHKS